MARPYISDIIRFCIVSEKPPEIKKIVDAKGRGDRAPPKQDLYFCFKIQLTSVNYLELLL